MESNGLSAHGGGAYTKSAGCYNPGRMKAVLNGQEAQLSTVWIAPRS